MIGTSSKPRTRISSSKNDYAGIPGVGRRICKELATRRSETTRGGCQLLSRRCAMARLHLPLRNGRRSRKDRLWWETPWAGAVTIDQVSMVLRCLRIAFYRQYLRQHQRRRICMRLELYSMVWDQQSHFVGGDITTS
jgi:hypothetical protein